MKKNSNWPFYSLEEIESVKSIMMSGKVNYWTGDLGKKFEKYFSKYHGNKYSIAVANGTLGLDLAIKSLKLNFNDEVIVTPRSFVASASVILTNHLKPRFCDIDYNSQSICPESLLSNINKKTKALILVHLAGVPARIDEIKRICKKYKIYLIEDCSQAHGAKYGNSYVGTFGDLAVWSFCQDKIISTLGEGGMVSTNNKKLFDFMNSYRDHGKNINKLQKYSKLNQSFKYIHDHKGSNFRLTEAQSSIGLHQLKNLKSMLRIRRKNANLYSKLLASSPNIIIPKVNYKVSIAYYKFYFYIKHENLKLNRDEILIKLNKMGVKSFSGSCPEIYLEKPFKKFKPKNRFKIAKLIGETSIMLLCDPMQDLNSIELNSKKIVRLLESYEK